ncbi:methenyltetrahydrofolate synthase domain-containing protein [Bacillus rossius redtenbacheri]|uniref:methenyltetrahydrofolate synthase domain-containing protein n=1 Tax=Bacillus rossius redtenbacheri TaxID=93214 RepID=UPI002FDD9A79
MSTNEEGLPEEVTKQSIRRKVWNHLEKENLAFFPRPVHGRIPNFKGSADAARNMEKLDFFQSAASVKVNPDKPQEEVRFLALQAKKNLYVPIPQLREGFITHVEPPAENVNFNLRVASTRRGADQWGKPIGLDSNIKIDLVVLGSVAVSKEGYRIGKGKGYADLEFALMMKMGAVTQDTIVATTVHDCQVMDLPPELFKEHDVPVDFIVTPTQVIEVTPRLPKPRGVIWSLLSGRRLAEMPVLQALREQELAEGVDCTLKEDSDVEEHPRKPRNSKPRVKKPRMRTRKASGREEGDEAAGEPAAEPAEGTELKNGRPSRTFRRRRNTARAREEGNGDCKPEDDGAPEDGGKRPGGGRRAFRSRPFRGPPKSLVDFSLRVTNISSTVRVRDLKSALSDCGVKPVAITWRGRSGFAVLHFAKVSNGDTGTLLVLDDLVSQLKELKIACGAEGDESGSLKIEPLAPITRIEVTDISSV